MRKGLIPNPVAAQKGWNCFDIAAGIDRDFVMGEALTDDPVKRARYRKLLAPEIRNAAMLTAVHMDADDTDVADQRAQLARLLEIAAIQPSEEMAELIDEHIDYLDLTVSGSDWLQFALPEVMGVDALADLVSDYFGAEQALHAMSLQLGGQAGMAALDPDTDLDAYEHLKDKCEEAEQAFWNYCESDAVYEQYIEEYYKKQGWFAFQPQADQTSMIDIVAAVCCANIVIYQGDDFEHPIYATQEETEESISVYYNGVNHFLAYDPDAVKDKKSKHEEENEKISITSIFRGCNFEKIAAKLREERNFFLTGQRGETPVHWAAFEGNVDLIVRLHHLGVPIDEIENGNGRTPLGYAVKGYLKAAQKQKTSYFACIQALLQCGANPDKKAGVGKESQSACELAGDLAAKLLALPKQPKKLVSASGSPFRIRKSSSSVVSLDIRFDVDGQSFVFEGNSIHVTLKAIENSFRREISIYRERDKLESLHHRLSAVSVDKKDKKSDLDESLGDMIKVIFGGAISRYKKDTQEPMKKFRQAVRAKILSVVTDDGEQKKLKKILGVSAEKIPSALSVEDQGKLVLILKKAKFDWVSLIESAKAEIPKDQVLPDAVKKDLKQPVQVFQVQAAASDEKKVTDLKMRVHEIDYQPVKPPSADDPTNFVVASMSFLVRRTDGKLKQVALPIVLSQQSVFSVYDTRDDRFVEPCVTGSSGIDDMRKIGVTDLRFERIALRAHSTAILDKQKLHHSEQAVFYHLYEEATQANLIRRLFNLEPNTQEILAAALDMHSTRQMCSHCQAGADGFVKDKNFFRRGLLAVVNRFNRDRAVKVVCKSDIPLYCRVSADVEHDDCPNPPEFSTDAKPVQHVVDPAKRVLKASTEFFNYEPSAAEMHRYSVARSGGADDDKASNIYLLSYMRLTDPVRQKAASIIFYLWAGVKYFRKVGKRPLQKSSVLSFFRPSAKLGSVDAQIKTPAKR